MKRRDFLKSAGCFVASASLSGLGACSDDKAISSDEPAGSYAFLQGVASGDPQATSVMLWTRAVTTDSASDPKLDPIPLILEVSKSSKLEDLVLSKSLAASSDSDFTVRVLLEELTPDTIYYYRFKAGSDTSRVGRTRTAPKSSADVPVSFAWVCCQDYGANYYSAYRQLINDDKAAAAADQLAFVLQIGDFVYETRSSGFQQAITDELESVMLLDKDGKPRVVPPFPSGGAMTADGMTNFAASVDDYRHLYRTFLSDPDLQEARARWPFISVWDDHEFSDDCWQTQANYTNDASTDEPSQKRRVAGSQAWFEYVPVVLSEAASEDDVKPEAKDFELVTVEDAPYTEVVEVTEPNNVKALNAITIYRNLRWGKHVELVLTDNRLYRSDHAIPEDITKDDILVFHPRAALPLEAVNIMDAGKTYDNGNPPDMAERFVNTRKDSDPGTLLGAKQKQWWKDVMKASDATFKLWGNTVPLLRIMLDVSDQKLLPTNLMLSPDAWDGYNTERKELMKFLQSEGIANVISLSGDHHAHYAGVIYDDYDAAKPKPVMVDVTCAGISSNSQFSSIGGALDTAVPAALKDAVVPVKRLITYDATAVGGTDKVVVNLNTLIRYGSHAANVAADTNDLAMIAKARDPKVNPHLRFASSHATGYGLASVTAEQVKTTLVTIERNFEWIGTTSPGIQGSAQFVIARVDTPDAMALPEPTLTGKKPFPLA